MSRFLGTNVCLGAGKGALSFSSFLFGISFIFFLIVKQTPNLNNSERQQVIEKLPTVLLILLILAVILGSACGAIGSCHNQRQAQRQERNEDTPDDESTPLLAS